MAVSRWREPGGRGSAEEDVRMRMRMRKSLTQPFQARLPRIILEEVSPLTSDL